MNRRSFLARCFQAAAVAAAAHFAPGTLRKVETPAPQMTLMDGLLLLAAFLDGALVGYAVTFLVTHMHACESLYGQNDVLFVDKGHRGKGVGLRLVRETERLAVSRGARMVTWGARKGSELAGLLPKIGYRATELLFTKEF